MTIRVFVSYSHLDRRYLTDSSLVGYLRGVSEDVEFWTDQEITVGNKWDDEIKSKIASTHIALVLVSQRFLDSAYCKNVEIRRFIQQSEEKGLVIFPIMLSTCEWDRHKWLKSRQFLPTGRKTVEDFKSEKRTKLFHEIRQQLRQQIERLREKSERNETTPPRERVTRRKPKVTHAVSAETVAPKVDLPASIRTKDRKEMILIPGSNFLMGASRRVVHVDDFYIDKYPVSNAEYKKFLDSIPPGQRPRSPRRWGDRYPKDKASHPVSGVSFSLAKRYAEWANKRLPTEMEWEKAARGTTGRKYPWGDQFDKTKCNTDESGINDTTPVDKYPDGASPYGVMDMAGNVWEWVNDWANDVEKIIKGGSYKLDEGFAICSSQDSYNPNSGRPSGVGFRCVKTPD